MSAEDAAEMLASLAENPPEEASGAPESPPARASRRSRRVSVDVDSSSDEEPALPRKRAKKTTRKPAKKSIKPAGTNKTKVELLAEIESLQAQVTMAIQAREAAETEKKSLDILVKGQKKKIKALEDVIKCTDAGDMQGQLNAARKETAAANARVVEALTEASIANAKKDLLNTTLK